MSNFDIITKGLRIGAFSGLAITLYAIATDSKWLLESKYFYTPKEKELTALSFDELKGRYLKALTRKSEE